MSAGGSGDQGALEALVALAAAALAAVVTVIWAGAETAALLCGAHARAGAGFVDAVAAVPALVADPGDPRSAWPAPVASRLPGPVGYWVATVPLAVGAA